MTTQQPAIRVSSEPVQGGLFPDNSVPDELVMSIPNTVPRMINAVATDKIDVRIKALFS